MTEGSTQLLILAAVVIACGILVSTQRRRVWVNDWEQAAIYVDSVFERLLPPGRHTVWGNARKLTIVHIGTAPQYAAVGPVDVVSKDRALLRLGATAVHRIDDVGLSLREPVWAQINLTVSTALIRLASAHTLEELMSHSEELDAELAALTGPRIGASVVESVVLTGLTLPPELRRLMTEVERARLEGLAALERARGEQAALRALSNAARLLKDNPELSHLRLLQAVGASRNATLIVGDAPKSQPAPPNRK